MRVGSTDLNCHTFHGNHGGTSLAAGFFRKPERVESDCGERGVSPCHGHRSAPRGGITHPCAADSGGLDRDRPSACASAILRCSVSRPWGRKDHCRHPHRHLHQERPDGFCERRHQACSYYRLEWTGSRMNAFSGKLCEFKKGQFFSTFRQYWTMPSAHIFEGFASS